MNKMLRQIANEHKIDHNFHPVDNYGKIDKLCIICKLKKHEYVAETQTTKSACCDDHIPCWAVVMTACCDDHIPCWAVVMTNTYPDWLD